MSQDKPSSPPVITWLNPEGLSVLAAAGVTAAVAAMPVIVVPGVLAYGILTWLRYTRWRDRADQAGTEPIAVDLSRLRHPYSSRVAMCVQLQSRVLADIAGADTMHKAMLQPSVDRVRSLAQASSEMAYKLQQIDDHLSREDVRSLDNEEAFLKNRVEGAQDPVARERFERALEQHHQKVALHKELRARWERIDAQLTNIQLTLETVSAQVLRIKSAEAGTASHESARVLESLANLSVDVEALAETVEETVEASGSLEAHRIRADRRERG